MVTIQLLLAKLLHDFHYWIIAHPYMTMTEQSFKGEYVQLSITMHTYFSDTS